MTELSRRPKRQMMASIVRRPSRLSFAVRNSTSNLMPLKLVVKIQM